MEFSEHNVLYFGENIDVRLTPKNCSTTLKCLWSESKGLKNKKNPNNPHAIFPAKEAETMGRLKRIRKNGGEIFREGSLKIAIKRDPVSRWLSVMNFSHDMCNYVRALQLRGANLTGDYADYLNLPYLGIGINHAVQYHLDNGILCGESISQYEACGNADQYDHIYTPSQFNECIELIEDYIHMPLSKDIFGTRSHNIRYQQKDLTDKSIDIIMNQIYKDDYDNGWG